MSEWRLFPEGTIPAFTTPGFFEGHAWIPGYHQVGHTERISMVVEVVRDLLTRAEDRTVVDIGCGDGSFLQRLAWPKSWGYDAGRANVRQAQLDGVNVRQANILTDRLSFGDITVITEVLEHLLDPHGFLKTLGGKILVATSPSIETDEWHYEHHAWAWDSVGYAAMITDAGWEIVGRRDVVATGTVDFGPVRAVRHPSFQCVVGIRRG
jgi:trans-aconitate methyltransferase